LIKKRQLETNRKNQFMSHLYNKALFTLSYLVSLQLRKYMELFTQIANMRAEDLQDPDIMLQKQQQIQKSVAKFKKHFKQNLKTLNDREVHKKVSPKFTICFSDLANYLGINVFDLEKDDKEKESAQPAEKPDTMPEKPLFSQTPK